VLSVGIGCGGVAHCFVVASSVSPREAQKSRVGCIAIIMLPMPDASGSAQPVRVSAAKATKCQVCM
jgi:hypothetical protein